MIHKPIHTLQIKGKELKRNNFLRLFPKSFHNLIKDQHSIYKKKKTKTKIKHWLHKFRLQSDEDPHYIFKGNQRIMFRHWLGWTVN